MPSLRSSLLFAALLAVPVTAPRATPPAPGRVASAPAGELGGFSAERLGDLHRYLGQTTAPGAYLGGVSLLLRDGRIVDWRAYGHRDLERRQPMRRDDIFRIYSMTKTVATVAVLRLVEQGRIGLDDPIAKVLPELADLQVASGTVAQPVLRPASTAITLRHLLTHTAGFPAGLPGDEAAAAILDRDDPHGARDLSDYVRRLAKAPLAAEPGTRFGYDGAGLEVAARLVEVLSGQDFDAYLQAQVLAPLKMHDTFFAVPGNKRGRVVDITTMSDDGRLRIADGPSARVPGDPLNAYPSAAGGLYSPAGDYARFCQMLLDGGTLDGATVLGRKTVDLMMLNHLAGMLDPPVTQYSGAEGFGLGGYVVLDVARRGVAGSPGQFGWAGAASTTYFVDRQEGLAAILMLQHLPRPVARDLPRVARRFQSVVYQALVP